MLFRSIKYSNFNYDVLKNRKITGSESGATALVEKIGQKVISTEGNYYELYVNDKTLLLIVPPRVESAKL